MCTLVHGPKDTKNNIKNAHPEEDESEMDVLLIIEVDNLIDLVVATCTLRTWMTLPLHVMIDVRMILALYIRLNARPTVTCKVENADAIA